MQSNDGTIGYLRPSRKYPSLPKDEVEIEPPPAVPSPPTSSLLFLILPIAGSVLTIILSSLIFNGRGLFYLISVPMMLLTTGGGIYKYFLDRKQYKERLEKRISDYSYYLQSVQSQLNMLVDKQTLCLNDAQPGPRDLVVWAKSLTTRLWERGPADGDFLSIRVGTGAVPISFSVKMRDRNQSAMTPEPLIEHAKMLAGQYTTIQAPVGVPLAQASIGLVGPLDSINGIAASLLAQITANHSPEHIRLAILCNEKTVENWRWARWLPHLWDAQHLARAFADEANAAGRIAGEICASAAAQQKQLWVVLVTDPDLLARPEMSGLLKLADISPLVRLVVLSEIPTLVPRVCKTILELRYGAGTGGAVRVSGPPSYEFSATFDSLSPSEAEMLARSLAPIRVLGSTASVSLPGVVGLQDLLEIDRASILDRWQNSQIWKSLAVPLGQMEGGKPLMLDLRETGQGPHGLIAGATGSGKSELIQALVLSLALNFHPNELAFLLVDYKGGGMANVLGGLPHVAGTITNLDANKAMRALVSLKAELERRQRLFAQYSVNHIDEYQKLFRQGQTAEPLPRLVMIVDEFAELSANMPDFMPNLISTARLGRSLGVNLILATQKPGGVVSDQIWSNSRFRLCLRVETTEDSKEVLKQPDAAYLTRPGQAYMQVGTNELFVLFQSAYGGAPYRSNGMTIETIQVVNLNGKRVKLWTSAPPDSRQQLAVVLEEINQAARQLNLSPQRPLWLPDLPNQLPSSALNYTYPEHHIACPMGLKDQPNAQRQTVLEYQPDAGNLLIVGGPRSGKTTTIETIVTGLSAHYPPSRLNFYLLDFGDWRLRSLNDLPQVGAVILSDEDERLRRLFAYLETELVNRKKRINSGGTLNDLPTIVVMLDNYPEFADQYLDDLLGQMIRIARDGNSLKVFFVITTPSINSIPTRLSGSLVQCVALDLTESSDYSLAVGSVRYHSKGLPGRGLVRDTPPQEIQLALPMGMEETKALANQFPGRAHRIINQPEVVWLEVMLDENRGNIPPGTFLVGLDNQSLEPIGVRLQDGGHFILLSDKEPNRLVVLNALLTSLLAFSSPNTLRLLLLNPQKGGSAQFAQYPHYIAGNPLEIIAAELARRQPGQTNPRGLLVIEEYEKAFPEYDSEALRLLNSIVRDGPARGLHILVSGKGSRLGSSMDQTATALRSCGSGFLVGNDATEASTLGLRLPYTEKKARPGDGFVVVRNQTLQVRFAACKEPAKLIQWHPVAAGAETQPNNA